MEKLSKLINKIVQEYEGEGHFGIAMEWRGQVFFLNENDVFPSASLIKLPVMVESFMQSSGGTLALEDLVEVRSLLRTGERVLFNTCLRKVVYRFVIYLL